jgi:hypothetical protein
MRTDENALPGRLLREAGRTTSCSNNQRRVTMTVLARIGLVAIGLSLQAPTVQAACNCGPDFCQDDNRIAAKLANKKKALAKEYPANLVALLDRGQQCIARIERSPDAFTIWVIDANNNKETVSWSAENQANAMKQVQSGSLKRFWIYNARRAFSCCGQPPYDQMSDYDKNDDVNASLAIKCDKSSPC